MQVINYANFNFSEELREVDDEFYLTVNNDTPGMDGDMDYRVTYQILINVENRTVSSKAIKIAEYQERYLPSGDIDGIKISI